MLGLHQEQPGRYEYVSVTRRVASGREGFNGYGSVKEGIDVLHPRPTSSFASKTPKVSGAW